MLHQDRGNRPPEREREREEIVKYVWWVGGVPLVAV